MSRSVWTNKSSMFLMSFEKKPIAIDPRLVRNFADVKPTLAHVASRPKQRVTTSPCSAARLAMAGLMRATHCAVSPRGGTPGLVGDETGASIGGRADGRDHEPGECREHAAAADPPPFRQAAARTVTVEHCKPDDDQHEHQRPAQIANERLVEAGQAGCGQQQRKHDDEAHGDTGCGNGAD